MFSYDLANRARGTARKPRPSQGATPMPFGAFRSIQEIARTFQITLEVGTFLELRPVELDERFVDDLSFTRAHVAVRVSEAAIGEFLVAPVLKYAWRPYNDILTFWSHVPLGTAEPLV